MREIRTETEIAAPPEKVWGILTDFENWKEWNPVVTDVSGEANLNSKLNIRMKGEGGKGGMNYAATITDLVEQKSFRWRATMVAGFLFTNDKIFELEESSSGTRVVHWEEFSGIMVGMFWGKLSKGVPPMLEAMNEALKKKAEN
ncbi:MAG: SRPBCC domain-containing protein [Flavobacteriales bacterium]|nr:SRPBCC domain-containing protein [Flavobacteriales bacterium]